MSVGFTGYRFGKLPFYRNDTARIAALSARLYAACALAAGNGERHFLSGFAQGSDLLFAEAVVKLQAEYPDVELEAALPFIGSDAGWVASDRALYARLLRRCGVVTVVSPHNSRGAYFRRNDYILEHSDLLIAVFDGKPGGTAYTVRGAVRRNIPTLQITP